MAALFAPENIPLLVAVALMLLVTLVGVVKIVDIRRGPLRPFGARRVGGPFHLKTRLGATQEGRLKVH